MKESTYQRHLIETLEEMFPGAIILKNDPNYVQGIPDLLILYRDRWAALEVKRSEEDYLANRQPNQEFYIDKMSRMSFAAFIYPENEEGVLLDIQQAFEFGGLARFSKR